MSDMVMGQGPFDMKYFLSGALAGGICCSITHGGLVPVDVVKTKIQLQPDVFNKGFIGGFGQVIEKEGMGGLLTGLGPGGNPTARCLRGAFVRRVRRACS